MTSNTLSKNHSEHLTKDDPLTSMPLPSLFLKMVLPMTIGMVINGLYNLIDAYFIGIYVGSIGFAAVSSIFPIQMLGIAIAAMIATGTSILLSQAWGAHERPRLTLVLRAALLSVITAGILFPIILLNSQQLILPVIGVTDPMLPDANAYLVPITIGSFLLFALFTCSDVLRAIANMQGLLIVILTGAISNIVLDYLFIVVLDMAVAGAAYATLLSQAIGLTLAIYLLIKSPIKLGNILVNDGPEVIHKCTSKTSNLVATTGQIISYGSPTLLNYLGAVLVIGMINSVLASASGINNEAWISAYGIISRINIFLILPLIAISNTCQTLAAHNFGAQRHERVQISLNIGLSIGIGYLLLMMTLIFGIPQSILGLFSEDINTVEHAEQIASCMFLLLPLVAVSSIGIGFLQAIGKAQTALILSFIKIYLVLTPFIVLIATHMNPLEVWYAFPLTESLTLPIMLFILYKRYNDLNCQEKYGLKQSHSTSQSLADNKENKNG